MTKLDVLLAGPAGTPYAEGVFKLQLKMPLDYPKSAPKAFFKTKIFHPNVEDVFGAVCLETLKSDWKPTLTLRDVLATISCLLIEPNPNSSLNAEAGRLIQDSYDDFSRQAKLMTSIHARIPLSMRDAVRQAQNRGEGVTSSARHARRIQTAPAHSQTSTNPLLPTHQPSRATTNPVHQGGPRIHEDAECDEEVEDDAKENDASLSRSPVAQPAALPIRRPALAKRPLSDLPAPPEPASDAEPEHAGMTCSERNIAANGSADLALKTPNLSTSFSGCSLAHPPGHGHGHPARPTAQGPASASARRGGGGSAGPGVASLGISGLACSLEAERAMHDERPAKRQCQSPMADMGDGGKENDENQENGVVTAPAWAAQPRPAASLNAVVARPRLGEKRKASGAGAGAKAMARIGVRRL